MSRLPLMRSLAGAAASLALFTAHAQQAYDLRLFNVAVDFPCCSAQAAAGTFEDLFNNGNPLQGGLYGGNLAGSGSYSAVNNGFSPGAELSGPAPDPAGVVYGAGRLRLSLADATPSPSTLDAPGTVSMSNRLALDNPGPGSLLHRGQSFEVALTWNFTTPDAGSSYGLRLNDNTALTITPGTPFNDLIDLRVVRGGAGQPVVNLRRLSYDGATLSAAETISQNVALALLPGHTLADVTYIELVLHYDTAVGALPFLRPSYTLVDGTLATIGQGSFAQQPTLFNGEDFTRASAGVSYAVAVPEPASAVLLLAGLLALGTLRRRRR